MTAAAGNAMARFGDDLVAGLVVGVIAMPLSIALAVAVGVPPAAGLYTAAFAGATAALFGGSSYNITGPTAALVPILAHTALVHGPAALPLVGLMAGLMLLAMGFLRFGRLMRYMPGLVVVGFTAGIALSIAFGQLNNLLGVSGTDPALDHFHEKTFDTLRHLGTVGLATPLVGLASILVLVAWARWSRWKAVPGPLVAVLLLTLVCWAGGLDTPTLASRYGEMPTGLPTPSLRFVDLGLVVDLLPAAFAVAVLGGVESLLSAVVADGMSGSAQRHDPDRELLGQGLANLVSPVMGGIPATPAIARSAQGLCDVIQSESAARQLLEEQRASLVSGVLDALRQQELVVPDPELAQSGDLDSDVVLHVHRVVRPLTVRVSKSGRLSYHSPGTDPTLWLVAHKAQHVLGDSYGFDLAPCE